MADRCLWSTSYTVITLCIMEWVVWVGVVSVLQDEYLYVVRHDCAASPRGHKELDMTEELN